jgi:hypothetical protein
MTQYCTPITILKKMIQQNFDINNRKLCPECKHQRLKSLVFPKKRPRTSDSCQPFYDEIGNYHDHDINITTTEYECSNGHKWIEESTNRCWCGWPDKKDKNVE